MTATHTSRHIVETIERDPADVYAFASDPLNLPAWASGLSTAISFADGAWVAESELGRITVEFVPDNPYGVLDHVVTLPGGTRVTNPLRVVPNGGGSDVVFSLFQLRPADHDAFEADAAAVVRDLARLKVLLESQVERLGASRKPTTPAAGSVPSCGQIREAAEALAAAKPDRIALGLQFLHGAEPSDIDIEGAEHSILLSGRFEVSA